MGNDGGCYFDYAHVAGGYIVNGEPDEALAFCRCADLQVEAQAGPGKARIGFRGEIHGYRPALDVQKPAIRVIDIRNEFDSTGTGAVGLRGEHKV